LGLGEDWSGASDPTLAGVYNALTGVSSNINVYANGNTDFTITTQNLDGLIQSKVTQTFSFIQGSGPTKSTASQPSCWAVGFRAVGNAFIGTFDPRPSTSTAVGNLIELGGDKPLAAEVLEAAPFLLFGFDINLVQQISSEIMQPAQCR
jgi:hypothetical protein